MAYYEELNCLQRRQLCKSIHCIFLLMTGQLLILLPFLQEVSSGRKLCLLRIEHCSDTVCRKANNMSQKICFACKNGKIYEVSLNVLVVAVNFQELLGNMRNVSSISLYPMRKLSRTKSFIFHRLFCFVFYEVRISCFRSCIYWCHS